MLCMTPTSSGPRSGREVPCDHGGHTKVLEGGGQKQPYLPCKQKGCRGLLN